MKCLSEKLDNFSMSSFFCRRSSSTVTLGCKLIGTIRPFWCFAVDFWLNFDFTTWVFEKPILETRWRNCPAIVESSISLIHLPHFTCSCTTARPKLLKTSLPMSIWYPSFTTDKQSSLKVQSLYFTALASFPSTLIGSLENVFKSLSCFLVIHPANSVDLNFLFARVFVMRLHTLPESITEIARINPELIFALKFELVCRITRNSCHMVNQIDTNTSKSDDKESANYIAESLS